MFSCFVPNEPLQYLLIFWLLLWYETIRILLKLSTTTVKMLTVFFFFLLKWGNSPAVESHQLKSHSLLIIITIIMHRFSSLRRFYCGEEEEQPPPSPVDPAHRQRVLGVAPFLAVKVSTYTHARARTRTIDNTVASTPFFFTKPPSSSFLFFLK